jgi:hypothetical protein
VREANQPPTKKGTPATNLRKVTHCGHESFIAMAKLTEPLAIEDLGWIGPYGYDAKADAARRAWERVRCLPKLRRLELASDHGSLDWLFRSPVAAQLEELVFAADADELARWRGELDGTSIPRFIIGDRPMNWRMGARIGFERDRTGVLSKLIVIAPATPDLSDAITNAIDELPKGTLTAAHVEVETTVWKASEAARTRLARAIRRAGVEATFEKTQKS